MSFRAIPGEEPRVLVNPLDYHAPQKAKRGSKEYVMSRSSLAEFAANHHKWLVSDQRDQETEALAWGTLMDVCVLTPERFDSVFAIAPETCAAEGMECPVCKSVTDSAKCRKCKTDRVLVSVDTPWNWNSNTCQEWREKRLASGLIVVKSETASAARKAKEWVFKNEHIAAFHAASRKQVQVLVEWHDEQTGIVVPFKCLVDLMPDPESDFGDTLADFKTTNDASKRKWRDHVFYYGLHIQAAIYLDAVNAATGLKYRCFEHHIQESSAPYEVTHRMLSHDPQGAEITDFISLGRTTYREHLRRYCDAIQSGKFRGYDTDTVEPTKYMIEADAA